MQLNYSYLCGMREWTENQFQHSLTYRHTASYLHHTILHIRLQSPYSPQRRISLFRLAAFCVLFLLLWLPYYPVSTAYGRRLPCFRYPRTSRYTCVCMLLLLLPLLQRDVDVYLYCFFAVCAHTTAAEHHFCIHRAGTAEEEEEDGGRNKEKDTTAQSNILLFTALAHFFFASFPRGVRRGEEEKETLVAVWHHTQDTLLSHTKRHKKNKKI